MVGNTPSFPFFSRGKWDATNIRLIPQKKKKHKKMKTRKVYQVMVRVLSQ